MGKNLDKLGKIEDFKAPWETETGSDAEIDSSKLKKFLFNLLTDKAKAEDASDEAVEAKTKAEQELTEKASEFAKGDTTGELGKVQTKLAEAENAAKTAQGNLDRLTVGIEKGLTPAQAKRLQGSTIKELEADADELLETFGVVKGEKPGDNDGDEEDEQEGRTAPRSALTLVNPADTDGGGKDYDYDKIAGEIASGNLF